jgi:hypothetical protein
MNLEALPLLHWKALEKFCSRQALATRLLQLNQIERTFTAGHNKLARAGRDNLAGLTVVLRQFSTPNLQSHTANLRQGPRERIECTYTPGQDRSRQAKIECRFVFANFVSVANANLRLHCCRQRSLLKSTQHIDNQVPTHRS